MVQSTASSPRDPWDSHRDQLPQHTGLPFRGVLSRALVEAACRHFHPRWRQRIDTSWITLSLFRSQVRSDDHSGDDAVDRFPKVRSDQGLPAVATRTSSSRAARQNPPERVFWDLVRATGQSIHPRANNSGLV